MDPVVDVEKRERVGAGPGGGGAAEESRTEAPPRPATKSREGPSHIDQLDGWRGLSIVCVLGAHMLPLGPKSWGLNEASGRVGMVLFFTLSGYLIASLLLARPDWKVFLVRRLCRILPLAYIYLAVVLLISQADFRQCISNFLFAINYDHQSIFLWNSPFWSLCVEIHFYLTVTVLVALAGRRGLWLLPGLCLAVTAARVLTASPASIETHLRVDEILAGATLALLSSRLSSRWRTRLAQPVLLPVLLVLLALSAHPISGPGQYARPYVAALLVGSSMWCGDNWLTRFLRCRPLKYLAAISYALYIIHPLTYRGWMDQGSTSLRYLVKRPISFVLLFTFAHLSTRYWESLWIGWGKRWTERGKVQKDTAPAETICVPAHPASEAVRG